MNTLKYTHFGIPVTYIGVTYKDLDVSSIKAKHLEGKMKQAPPQGLLVIQGSAAPVINQLHKQGRSMRGIDFIVRAGEAFEPHEEPKADVILIYNVGAEVSMKSIISGKVLNALLKHYASRRTLVVLETHLTKSELRHNYDINVSNYVTLNRKPDEVWV